jgi:hypothetical protein
MGLALIMALSFMPERPHASDSTIPAPIRRRLIADRRALGRARDWGLVAGSFGLILLASMMLRPQTPQPHKALPPTIVVIRP